MNFVQFPFEVKVDPLRLWIQDSGFSNSLLERGKKPNLFLKVVLADACVPSDTVANEVFVLRGGKLWSLLVDAVQAADEGIVGEGDAGGVDREWIVLERT